MSVDAYEPASQTLTFFETDDAPGDYGADTQASQYDYDFTLPSQTQTQASQVDHNHVSDHSSLGKGRSAHRPSDAIDGKISEVTGGLQELNFEETYDEEDTTYTKDLPKHACRYIDEQSGSFFFFFLSWVHAIHGFVVCLPATVESTIQPL